MNWKQHSVSNGCALLRWACAVLLSGLLPAWAGPKEDGDAAFKAGKMAEADAAYTRALAAKPDDASCLIKRARARDSLGRKAEAAADFDQAVQLAPNNSDARHYRGTFRYLKGDNKGALEDFNKFAELAPQSANAFERRAAVEIALKDYNAAIIDSTRAVQIRPDFVVALNWRGFAWQQLKDTGSALRDYEAVIKLDPRNTYALTHRAMIYEARGEKGKAMQEYSIVLALDPKQRDAASHLARLQNPVVAKNAADGASAAARPPQSAAAATTPAQTPRISMRPAAIFQSAAASGIAGLAGVLNSAVRQASANGSQSSGEGGTAAQPVPQASGNVPQVPASAPATASADKEAKQAPESATPPAPAAPESSKPPPLAASNTQPAPTSTGAPKTREPLPRGGYYRLIKVKMPAFDLGRYETNWRDYEALHPGETMRGQFQGDGPAAQWSYDETSRSNDAHPQQIQHGDSLAWSVPDGLIPGKSAHFHMGSTIRGNDARFMGNSGHVVLDTAFGRIYLVAVYNYPPGHMPRPHKNEADDFDLTIPAELPALFATYRSLPNPNQTPTSVSIRDPAVMEEVVKSPLTPAQEQTPNSLKAPGEVGIVSSSFPLYSWANADLVVTVVNDDFGGAALNLAEYTYHWVGPPSIPGSVESLLEISLEPGPKENLQADGKDGIWIRARVNPKDASDAAAANAATAGITFTADGPNRGWMDLNYKPEVRDGWMVTQVQASNPDAARGGYVKPPASVTMTAHAQKSGTDIAQSLDIPIAPDADIDAKPDVVELTSQSGETAKVSVGIDNAGPDPWDFHAEFDKDSRKVALAEIKTKDGKTATLTLKEAGLDPLHDGSNREQAVLKITAEQKGHATLERDIKVNVVQEGLFVSTTGRDPETGLFVVNGDGKGAPTEIDVRVYGKDPKTKKIVNLTANAETLKALSATCLELKGSTGSNVLEVGKLDCHFDRLRQAGNPAGVLRLVLPKEVPADGRIVPCDFKISYNDRSEASFSSIVTIGVATAGNGPGSPNWQEELDRCQEVITKFVPATYYPKMQAMLDRRKMTLGPDGLRELRRKIWSAAAQLTLGEGEQGYASEAAWAGAITDVLEWSQWAGDMAFNAAIGTFTGPYGAAGAGMLKGAVISAVNAYQEGETADAWLWENLGTLPGMVEGQLVDPSKFQQWGMESKAKAWALYVSYHFLKNVYEGQTLVEALKNTAKEAGGNVLGSWLGEEVTMHGNASVTEWTSQKGQQITTAMAKFKALAAPTSPAAKTAGTEPTAPTPEAAVPTRRQAEETTATKGATEQPSPEEQPATPNPGEAAATQGAREQAPALEAGPAGTQTEQKPGAQEPATPAQETSATKSATEQQAPAAQEQAAAPAAEPTPAQEAEVVSLVRDNTTHGLGGQPLADLHVVIAIMTDPTMVRALKNAPAEVQQAFANTRETIYRWHDGEVVQHVKETVPGMSDREVRVLEFRTPGATGPSLNTDRDYRVCYMAGHDNNGAEIWIEVPRRYWEDTSYNTFARLTGGPTGSPKASKDWADEHQQLATDKYHPEASPAFSDQKNVFNKATGKYEPMQVVSNVEQVMAVMQRRKWNADTRQWETIPEDAFPSPVGVGDVIPSAADSGSKPVRVDLEDPQSLGQMYEVKVHDARLAQEAFVQANKAVQTLICLRKSYNVQGREIGTVSPEVLAGMQAVTEVTEKLAADPNRRDPKAVADAVKTLRANGFPSLGDFMNKLGGQFESFKNM